VALNILDELRRRLPGAAPPDIFTLTRQCHQELETRVGESLSAGLTEAQLGEFDKTLDSGDEDVLSRWLRVTRPNFQKVTLRGTSELLDEVTARILSADPLPPWGRGSQSPSIPRPSPPNRPVRESASATGRSCAPILSRDSTVTLPATRRQLSSSRPPPTDPRCSRSGTATTSGQRSALR